MGTAATGSDTELVEIDATSGKEPHRAWIRGFAASLNITRTSAGWLVYAEKTVTRVDLATGSFRLALLRTATPATRVDAYAAIAKRR